MGGRPHINAEGKYYGGKGTWVLTGDNTTIENVELSNAKVPDQNGAAIRQEGAALTLRRCGFHDNENGILTGRHSTSEILIEHPEFGNNGYGDGQSHNLYIGTIKSFTFRFSSSHHAKIGHLIKSRALVNRILYSRLMDEGSGTSSYAIDLPNGGTSFILGNIIQQGKLTDNSATIAYAAEGAKNPSQSLFVVNNTIVNDLGSGTFVQIGGSVTVPALLQNKIFWGGGTVTNQRSAVLDGNVTTDPLLKDRANYKYQPLAGSPAINAGKIPGEGAGESLLPLFHYVHPTERAVQPAAGRCARCRPRRLGLAQPGVFRYP